MLGFGYFTIGMKKWNHTIRSHLTGGRIVRLSEETCKGGASVE